MNKGVSRREKMVQRRRKKQNGERGMRLEAKFQLKARTRLCQAAEQVWYLFTKYCCSGTIYLTPWCAVWCIQCVCML